MALNQDTKFVEMVKGTFGIKQGFSLLQILIAIETTSSSLLGCSYWNQKSSNAFYYSFFGIIFVVVMRDESGWWIPTNWIGKLFKSIMILIKFLSKNVAVRIFINFPSITFFRKLFFSKISMNEEEVKWRGGVKSSEMVFDFD